MCYSLEEVKNYNKKYIDNLDNDNKTKLNNEIESIQSGSSEELINFYSGFLIEGLFLNISIKIL